MICGFDHYKIGGEKVQIDFMICFSRSDDVVEKEKEFRAICQDRAQIQWKILVSITLIQYFTIDE